MRSESEVQRQRADQAESSLARAEQKLQLRNEQAALEQRRVEILARRLRKLYETIDAAGGLFLLSGAQRDFWKTKAGLNWTEGSPDNIDGAA